MGELILCSQQLAAMPYYIENVSLNVYSLDELCYYIKNNTCLLDADFMDDELCDWVENEQHLPDIAQNLRNIKAGGGVLSEFTGCLMSACGYCTKEEQKQIRNTLQEMEHKSAFECGKIKADRFLENRKYVSSIAEYRKLLQSCETEMPQMVGAVWHNLGTAYARLFLFEQAADCYARAYEKSSDKESLKECLMACRCNHDERAFERRREYFKIEPEEAKKIADELSSCSRSDAICQFETMLDEWDPGDENVWETQLEEWKKRSFEEKMDDLSQTVLTENNIKDPKQVEQYVVERLEQMIDITREIEEEKSEYRTVTSYLNDVQKLEDLPEPEKKKIADVAQNVVQLNSARNIFLNSEKKLTDAQFTQLQQEEKTMPDAIKRLSSNEIYQDTIKKDMKYLEREKSRWLLHREYLMHQQKSLKNLLYIILAIVAAVAVTLITLQLGFKVDTYYAWMVLIFVTAVAVCADYLKMLHNDSEIKLAERSANKAILLLNKVKFKYVNITNAIDYACEKYHVRRASELNQLWQYYMDAVREREKYQRTNEDLEYFNGRLVRALNQYQLYDAQVWITQAAALIDPKEMVEVKHGLILRRQKLRDRMEYNVEEMKNQREEALKLSSKAGSMKPQIDEIINAIDRLMETM